MADTNDQDEDFPLVYFIDRSIISYSNTVSIFFSRQFFTTTWARVFGQFIDGFTNSLNRPFGQLFKLFLGRPGLLDCPRIHLIFPSFPRPSSTSANGIRGSLRLFL